MPNLLMLASAGDTGAASGGGIGTIVNAVGDVVSMCTKVFDVMVANPLLLFFTAAGVLSCAIGVFAHLKHVAK